MQPELYIQSSTWTDAALAAYAAGHIDSDGSIGITANGTGARTVRLRVCLYNNCGPTIRFVQHHFGGTIHIRKARTQNGFDQHVLVWQAKAAYHMLGFVLPYLQTKADQGQLAIEFYERNHQHNTNGWADRSWQWSYYERMRALNGRYNSRANPHPNPAACGRPQKLTPQDVRDIRRFYKRGLATRREMSRLYNVSYPTIHTAISGRTWASLV